MFRTQRFHSLGPGSILGWQTKIPQATWHSEEKRNLSHSNTTVTKRWSVRAELSKTLFAFFNVLVFVRMVQKQWAGKTLIHPEPPSWGGGRKANMVHRTTLCPKSELHAQIQQTYLPV